MLSIVHQYRVVLGIGFLYTHLSTRAYPRFHTQQVTVHEQTFNEISESLPRSGVEKFSVIIWQPL